MSAPEQACGEDHGEHWSREEDGGGVADGKPLHGLVDQPEEEAAKDPLGHQSPPRGNVGRAERGGVGQPHERQHGGHLDEASDEEQVPGGGVRAIPGEDPRLAGVIQTYLIPTLLAVKQKPATTAKV